MAEGEIRNGFPYPGPDATDAPRLMVPAAITLAIALILYVVRMYTRIRPVNTLGWDDCTVSVAMALATVATVFAGLGCYFGVGRRSYYVDYEQGKKANYYSFVAQPLVVWAICFAKCSVACMLLRVKKSTGWRTFLYIAIAIQICSATAANVAQLIQCHPLSAYWDPKVAKDPATTCWSPIDIQISAYVNAGISIVTDVVFSLLPIVFLRKLNRPLRERLVLGLLMALGLTATLASILKVTLLYNYRNTRDPYWDSIPLSLWWQLEQNISIIASCIPTLKSPFEKALRRTGMISTQSGTAHSSRGYVSYGGGSDHKMKNLKTIVQGGEVIQEIPDDARSEDSILRMERQAYVATPQKGINKRTDIHSSTEQLVAEMDWAAVQKKAIGQTDGHSTESWVG